jgi:hypothetical protein
MWPHLVSVVTRHAHGHWPSAPEPGRPPGSYLILRLIRSTLFLSLIPDDVKCVTPLAIFPQETRCAKLACEVADRSSCNSA